MKVELKEFDRPKSFQPFQLLLTIENEKDLENLWHRFNLNQISGSSNVFIKTQFTWDSDGVYLTPQSEIWEFLNDKAINMELK